MRYNAEDIVELVERKKVPQMIKHCVIKVFQQKSGSNEQKFINSFQTCMDTFKKHGYMYKGAYSKLTFRGIKQNRKHQREGSVNVIKNKQFSMLYGKIFSKLADVLNEERVRGKKR